MFSTGERVAKDTAPALLWESKDCFQVRDWQWKQLVWRLCEAIIWRSTLQILLVTHNTKCLRASITAALSLMCAGASAMLDCDKPGSSMVEIQCLLDNVGTSELVIDLIVNTKNDRVFEESILLGIALLQGGNTQIQVGLPFSFCFIFNDL